MKQELFTLPDHLSSPMVLMGFVCFLFFCSVLEINVCTLYFGHYIVFSLRFTASDYTFDIFNIFLSEWTTKWYALELVETILLCYWCSPCHCQQLFSYQDDNWSRWCYVCGQNRTILTNIWPPMTPNFTIYRSYLFLH